MKAKTKLLSFLLVFVLTLCACAPKPTTPITLENIPEYDKSPYVVINDNTPFFEESDYTTTSYEKYSPLDSRGRCGVAMACIGKDIMPTEEREESLSSVTPTGWKQENYDGTYLYHRCHLIGFQLTGENANKYNLITGTGYFNVTGMLPFENQVADYIKDTGNHVLYRVTPIFEGNNLVASGVLMEAYSVEDAGAGVTFCVYVYNVQPGIFIHYLTGDSSNISATFPDEDKDTTDGDKDSTDTDKNDALLNEEKLYVINVSTKKFHLPSCTHAQNLTESKREERTTTAKTLLDEDHSACGTCLKGLELAYQQNK